MGNQVLDQDLQCYLVNLVHLFVVYCLAGYEHLFTFVVDQNLLFFVVPISKIVYVCGVRIYETLGVPLANYPRLHYIVKCLVYKQGGKVFHVLSFFLKHIGNGSKREPSRPNRAFPS